MLATVPFLTSTPPPATASTPFFFGMSDTNNQSTLDQEHESSIAQRTLASSNSNTSHFLSQGRQRPFKPNPLLRQHETRKAEARERYLSEVRSRAEDRKRAARGGDDEMMRTIQMAEHKAWMAYQERIAQEMAQLDEQEMDTTEQDTPESEPEPEPELEIEMDMREEVPEERVQSPSFDDEDYDSLFLEVIQHHLDDTGQSGSNDDKEETMRG